MKIKPFQTLIDTIRGKIQKIKNIKGDSNKICYVYKNKESKILYKYKNVDINIQGKGNTVIFHVDTNNFIIAPNGLDINIIGNNNLIEIYEPNFGYSYIEMTGDNNSFLLRKTVKKVRGAKFFIEDGGEVTIEENCEIGNGDLYVVVNGDYKNHHKLHIKKGTHIAREAIIRTSDGECLIDPANKKPISEPKNVIIGENCWITSRCTILKGTELQKGTIVGANSLVNKKFLEPNTLIAGIPAKVIKNNVAWIPESYGKNMRKLENKEL